MDCVRMPISYEIATTLNQSTSVQLKQKLSRLGNKAASMSHMPYNIYSVYTEDRVLIEQWLIHK